jgi:hypothetical protein
MSLMDEIRRAAQGLLEQYGEKAASVADRRAKTAELGGSNGAGDLWRQVAAAIRAMQVRHPEPP